MKTIIIQPEIKSKKYDDPRTTESKLEEANGLALAIDLDVILAQIVSLQKIIPATYLSKGKLEEIQEFIANEEVKLAIFNDHLTPIQQRNLENSWKCKVIDRTALILEIFGKRAQTKEGRLQVELAAQEYQKSRLVRSWTHLERQRGGGGFLGGPGEKQIESDRRAIKERIAILKKHLKKVAQTREIHRKSRRKIPYAIVALVGYTNAGKSTLFNKITGAQVMAEDKLFATLDPTMRHIKLESGRDIILSDTVGFISDLPTELVAAFRATLEEVIEADIILHVRDISNNESEEQKKDVLSILESLGLKKSMDKTMIEVLNKIDLIEDNFEKEGSVSTSAKTGEGIDSLLTVIDEKLSKDSKYLEINVNASEGKIIAWIHSHSDVQNQYEEDGKIYFQMYISEKNLGRLNKMIDESK